MPIDTRPGELDIDPEIAGCCRDACRVLSFEAPHRVEEMRCPCAASLYGVPVRRPCAASLYGVPVRRPCAASLYGVPGRRPDDGYPEWQGAGLAVEASA